VAMSNDSQKAHTMIRLVSSPDAFDRDEVGLQSLKNLFEHTVKGPMDGRYPGQGYGDVQLSYTYPGNGRSGHISADILSASAQNSGGQTWNYLSLNRKPHYLTSEDARFELFLAFVLVLMKRHDIRFEIRSTVQKSVRNRAVEAARLVYPDLAEPEWLPVTEVIERPDHLDFRA